MPDSLQDQVIAAEERLRLAVLFSDLRALDELLSDALHFTDQSGHVASKADDLAFHRAGALRLVDLSPSEQHIQLLPGGAVVSVLTHMLGRLHGQPLNQLVRFTRVWAAGPDGALHLIAGHASELQPAGAGSAAAPGGPPTVQPLAATWRVTGRVMWASQPVPGARVVLKAPGNYYAQPILAEASAGADGWFAIENLPAGKWAVYGVAPSDEYWEWTNLNITLGPGRTPEVLGLEFSKKMQLLAPEVGATLDTTTPTLRWASFPEAVRYQVAVFDEEKQEAVMQAETAETSLVVTPELTPGGRYQWSVSAVNARHQSIAYFSSWRFMVKS